MRAYETQVYGIHQRANSVSARRAPDLSRLFLGKKLCKPYCNTRWLFFFPRLFRDGKKVASCTPYNHIDEMCVSDYGVSVGGAATISDFVRGGRRAPFDIRPERFDSLIFRHVVPCHSHYNDKGHHAPDEVLMPTHNNVGAMRCAWRACPTETPYKVETWKHNSISLI